MRIDQATRGVQITGMSVVGIVSLCALICVSKVVRALRYCCALAEPCDASMVRTSDFAIWIKVRKAQIAHPSQSARDRPHYVDRPHRA